MALVLGVASPKCMAETLELLYFVQSVERAARELKVFNRMVAIKLEK